MEENDNPQCRRISNDLCSYFALKGTGLCDFSPKSIERKGGEREMKWWGRLRTRPQPGVGGSRSASALLRRGRRGLGARWGVVGVDLCLSGLLSLSLSFF